MHSFKIPISLFQGHNFVSKSLKRYLLKKSLVCQLNPKKGRGWWRPPPLLAFDLPFLSNWDNDLSFGDFWFQNLSKAGVNSVFKFFGTNLRNVHLKTRGQHWSLKRKWKILIFSSLLKQIILFLFEIKFYVKNTFFRGSACWNCSKITKFTNFAHF